MESTVVVRGEEPPHKLKRRYTRTRSGCERCRAQRRKCDEGKPRCRRCANADAGCKYTMHISFKTKNSQTLRDGTIINAIGSSMFLNTYNTIEFVPDDGAGGIKPSNHSSDSADVEQCSNHGSSTNVLPSPSDTRSAAGWPLSRQSPLSSVEIELLKYYSHHIAPWLDVYDQGQTFSHHVPRLAMTSPCVLELLLQVSAVVSSRPMEIVQRRGAGLFHIQAMSRPPGIESPSSALRTIACFALARTLLFVESIPDTWESNFRGDGAFIYFRKFNFLDKEGRQMWFAFLTLILRLEISYCLMNQRAPVWIFELAHHIETQSGADESNPQQNLNASLHCLRILVDVMNFSFLPTEVSDATTALGRVSTSCTYHVGKWNELLDRLREWYENRPLGLKPLAEVEHSTSTFPVVIFPTGAGVSSNTVYHAAMLILLIHRPQVIPFGEQTRNLGMDRAQMCAQWHAHRICGIAMNSEPEFTRCWDPVMIAAFSFAARWMKRSTQQNNIITYLNHLKVAGWHIDGLIIRLCREWNSIS